MKIGPGLNIIKAILAMHLTPYMQEKIFSLDINGCIIQSKLIFPMHVKSPLGFSLSELFIVNEYVMFENVKYGPPHTAAYYVRKWIVSLFYYCIWWLAL